MVPLAGCSAGASADSTRVAKGTAEIVVKEYISMLNELYPIK